MRVGHSRFDVAGGIDQIPMPHEVEGALFLCGFGVIGPDPSAALADVDATLAVCLLTKQGIARRFPAYAEWLLDPAPHEAIHVAIEDYHVIEDEPFIELVDEVVRRLRDGQRILAHCGAGWGRAGQLTLGVLLALGAAANADVAVDHLRAHRPGSGPESPAQKDQLARLVLHYQRAV